MIENNQAKETKYAGAGWIRAALKIPNMSPLGETVADLLGDVFFGIYHLDGKALKSVAWYDSYVITVTLDRPLATFDSDSLTRLVVLSHDRMLRVDITPRSNRTLQLMFHGRTSRTGPMSQRLPSMEDHMMLIRKDYSSTPIETK